MATPYIVDALFADWLAAHEQTAPTDRELATFIAGLPLPAQRRAARLYARGFLRGCEYCTPIERARLVGDLAAIEERLAALLGFVRALLAPPAGAAPPESTG